MSLVDSRNTYALRRYLTLINVGISRGAYLPALINYPSWRITEEERYNRDDTGRREPRETTKIGSLRKQTRPTIIVDVFAERGNVWTDRRTGFTVDFAKSKTRSNKRCPRSDYKTSWLGHVLTTLVILRHHLLCFPRSNNSPLFQTQLAEQKFVASCAWNSLDSIRLTHL